MTIPNLLEPHINRGNKVPTQSSTTRISLPRLPPSTPTIVSLPTFIHVYNIIPTPFSNTHLSHPLSGMTTFDRRRTIFKPVIKTSHSSSELLKNKTVQKHNDAIYIYIIVSVEFGGVCMVSVHYAQCFGHYRTWGVGSTATT